MMVLPSGVHRVTCVLQVKLGRLVRHMELKDFKAATFKGLGAEEEDTGDTGESV